MSAEEVVRCIVDGKRGYPDRVEVRGLEPGETALPLNCPQQPAGTPYCSSHAILVREGAERAYEEIDTLPEVMLVRPLSLRGFDAGYMLVDADAVDGTDALPMVARFLDDPRVAYIHVHTAKRGCYLARIDRA